MIPQVAHRLPQVRLRRGAEDLRGGTLRLGVRRAEQDPPAPDSVLGPSYLEANGDELSVESDGGKVVDDRFGRIGCVVARSEEHTSELQSQSNLVCRLLLE